MASAPDARGDANMAYAFVPCALPPDPVMLYGCVDAASPSLRNSERKNSDRLWEQSQRAQIRRGCYSHTDGRSLHCRVKPRFVQDTGRLDVHRPSSSKC